MTSSDTLSGNEQTRSETSHADARANTASTFEQPVRVLHIDDNERLVEMASTFLERANEDLTVVTETAASDGLDRFETDQIDCIVSDYQMPRMNGLELLNAVREQDTDVPFILFTGKGSEEVASDAIASGVSDYLQKDSGTEQYALLANRINNLVTQHRAEAGLETRIRQQDIVAELGQDALSGVPLESLFEQAVTTVADVLDNDYAKVLDYRPEHNHLLLRAGVGWRDGLVGEGTVGDGADSQAGHTLRSEEPIIVDDLRTEERFSGPPLLVEHNVVSGISVIIGTPENPWGVLGTHTTDRVEFTEDDINFVQSVANVLATAIERKEREQELQRQNDRLEEFTSIVSHDLKSPLNVAQGNVDLAQEECDSAYLDDVADALNRSQALIEDLLTLAREGERVNNVSAVAITETVEACWQNIETAEATLVTETERTIRANRSSLQQLLANLVRNAVEHGGGTTTVTIGDLVDGFYVADDGPAIPKTDRKQVFEAGYSTTNEGVGLGLNIVEQITDAHGWTITVTDSESGGARFEITGIEIIDS